MKTLVVFVFMVIMQLKSSHARTRVKDPRTLCIVCADDELNTCSSTDVTTQACDHVLGAWRSVRTAHAHGRRTIDMNAYVSGSQFKQMWEDVAGYNILDMDVWLCLSITSETGGIKCEGWANFNTWTVYDADEHVYADMDDWLCTMRYLWVPAFVSSKTGGRIKVGQLIELPTDTQCDREL
jgi:hypothetical protein